MKEFRHRLLFSVAIGGFAAVITGVTARYFQYSGPGIETGNDALSVFEQMAIAAVAMFLLVLWATSWGSS